MTGTTTDTEAIQRRTLVVLMLSVGPAGMGMAGGFSATSLAAEDITGNDGLATLAATTISIGGAMAAVPLARRMAAKGRRPGLRTGWTIAGIGSLVAFVSVLADIYPLLVGGAFAIGVGNGTNLAARYAAADLAPPDRRARTIGLLVWASSIGSVLGPTVALGPTGWLAEQLDLPRLSGPYLMGALVFAVAGLVVQIKLRPDPLTLATSLSASAAVAPARSEGHDTTAKPRLLDSFSAIARHQRAVMAVGAMAVGQAVMVAIMTVTPLHMDDGDHETQIIGLVISLHIVGMFFFAPVVGWFVDRLPTEAMVAAAGAILFVGGELASHTDPADSLGVFVGLFLIGLGWSFAMISGSSLLTGAFPAHERANVQGAADFTMVASGAAAGLASGVIVEQSSFGNLSHWAGVAALSLVAAAVYPLANGSERSL
ncbi:MAG: MFS transporter [Acidimicrobiaceae bacterium]|nr:MFS transporter [Acidimicrobiaceae bacterium]